ncbi:MAG: twin-arginine translocation signal domain-containing protein [Coriobacteriia bacterium]|nr:twin-arginine translocation signal domain-containing protein [Coriobacteriia bacterium]
MEQKGMDRRGFIVGSAVAAAGLSIGLPSLAIADGEVKLPPAGQWPYVKLDPEEVGRLAVDGTLWTEDYAGQLDGAGG